MKTSISKLKLVLGWAALCVVISLMTIPSANAIGPFLGFGFLCGITNTEPTVVHTSLGSRKVVISTTTTVLKGQVNGKNKLRHFVVVKLVRPDGSVVWTRSLITQSLAIATVISTDPPVYFISEALQIPDRTASPVIALPTECLGVGVVESGGTQRIYIVLGTSASSGGTMPVANTEGSGGSSGTEAPVKGQDKSVINIWLLNVNNGTVARTFRPRAQPNWFLLPTSSSLFDIDDDGDDELVLVRARFIGEDRYDYKYESFNIISGALENTMTTTQNNKLILQK